MQKTMTKAEKKSLNSPEETRNFENGKVEVVKVSDVPVGRATFQPGWKWSTCVKPIAKTASCQSAHFGYQISGTMVTVMDDDSSSRRIAGILSGPRPEGHIIANTASAAFRPSRSRLTCPALAVRKAGATVGRTYAAQTCRGR